MKTDYRCPECFCFLEIIDGLYDCVPCGLTLKLVDDKPVEATLEDINEYWSLRNRQELIEDNQ